MALNVPNPYRSKYDSTRKKLCVWSFPNASQSLESNRQWSDEKMGKERFAGE